MNAVRFEAVGEPQFRSSGGVSAGASMRNTVRLSVGQDTPQVVAEGRAIRLPRSIPRNRFRRPRRPRSSAMGRDHAFRRGTARDDGRPCGDRPGRPAEPGGGAVRDEPRMPSHIAPRLRELLRPSLLTVGSPRPSFINKATPRGWAFLVFSEVKSPPGGCPPDLAGNPFPRWASLGMGGRA